MSSTIPLQVFLWSLFLHLISTSVAADDTPSFQGCSVIGFPPVSSEAQVVELQSMVDLDFFVGPSMHSNSQVMTCGEQKDKLKQLLASYKIEPVMLVEDMSQMARSRDHFADIPLGTMDWNDYHGLENIYAWLDKVVQTYPKLISMQVIGTTHEKRQVRVYKIDKPGGSSKKKGVYLECLIHPREWTISGVCTYIINELTANSDKYTMDDIRFYIVPVVNPDGFAYTNGTGHDFWRKNRRPIPRAENITCGIPGEQPIGTDLNRNWPFQWKESLYPCAEIFPGEKGVVEAEIKAITDFLLSHKDVDTFVDIHSYSQLVMTPWGYTKDRPSNYKELIALARTAATEAQKIEGIFFNATQVSELLGISNGGSMDWAFGPGQIRFTFALEMRPDTKLANSKPYRYPFRVFPKEILPVCKEAWAIVQVLASKEGKLLLSSGAKLLACTSLLSAVVAFWCFKMR